MEEAVVPLLHTEAAPTHPAEMSRRSPTRSAATATTTTTVEMAEEAALEEDLLRRPLMDATGDALTEGNGVPRLRRRSPKVREVADPHNRCCHSRFWCVRVSIPPLLLLLLLAQALPFSPQDCCGVVCAVFTYLLILYAEYVVVRVILLPDLARHSLYVVVNLFLFQTLTGLAVASHVKTMLTDPVGKKRGENLKKRTTYLNYLQQFACPPLPPQHPANILFFYDEIWEITWKNFCVQ